MQSVVSVALWRSSTGSGGAGRRRSIRATSGETHDGGIVAAVGQSGVSVGRTRSTLFGGRQGERTARGQRLSRGSTAVDEGKSSKGAGSSAR